MLLLLIVNRFKIGGFKVGESRLIAIFREPKSLQKIFISYFSATNTTASFHNDNELRESLLQFAAPRIDYIRTQKAGNVCRRAASVRNRNTRAFAR